MREARNARSQPLIIWYIFIFKKIFPRYIKMILYERCLWCIRDIYFTPRYFSPLWGWYAPPRGIRAYAARARCFLYAIYIKSIYFVFLLYYYYARDDDTGDAFGEIYAFAFCAFRHKILYKEMPLIFLIWYMRFFKSYIFLAAFMRRRLRHERRFFQEIRYIRYIYLFFMIDILLYLSPHFSIFLLFFDMICHYAAFAFRLCHIMPRALLFSAI